MFTKNESDVDRIIRAIVGILLAISGLMYFNGWLQIIIFIVAIILILTAVTGFCLIYKLLGIGTLKKKSA